MKYALPIATFLTLSVTTLSAQTTIADEVGDLSFAFSGGTSATSSTASSLSIETAKNGNAIASLGSAFTLGVGDSINVSLTFSLDNAVTDTSSSVELGFLDSNTASTNGIFNNWYDFSVGIDPVTTDNSVAFAEGDDNNLGKFDADTTLGTSTHTFNFSLERVAADTLDLTFSSPTVSSTTRTVQNDVIPLQTNTFDNFVIAFRGNGWNEDFGGSSAIATIENFSLTTTVPEPSSFALLAGLLGLASITVRRRT